MQDEIKSIMEGVVERALHDFRGHKLQERFKEFNKEKDEARNIGILNALADRETKMRHFAIYNRGAHGAKEDIGEKSGMVGSARLSASNQVGSPDNSSRGKESSGKQWHSGEKRLKHKKKHRLYKDYKYPVGINDNPMEFLNENLDDLLAYADEKAKKEAAANAAEANMGSPKQRNKKKID